MYLNFNCFMLRSETSCAEVAPLGHTINTKSHRVDVRLPTPAGMPFGMAYIMTELW